MKQKILLLAIIIFLFINITYYIQLPDYYVINSVSFSSENTRDTEIKVVIYKYWNIDETIKAIEEEHNRINGTPTTLEIHLYFSKWHITHKAKPFKIIVFKYDRK